MLSHGVRAIDLFTRTAGRARRLGAAVAVAGLALAGLTTAGAAPAGAARANVVAPGIAQNDPTASGNNLRNGWDPNEPTLTPAAVSGGTFGQLFKTALKGQIYAQPLVIGSTVIVATEQDWVYGLNATTGAILWSDQLGTPYNITSCSDLVPDIGVTSTPVYDPSTNTVYVMALVKEISYEYHLFGINASTGAITLKQRIAGTATNDSHITFNAITQNQRVGLLLMNGWVYAGFASYCDHGTYNGFIGGVNVTTHATTLWTDESGTTDTKGGIWQSGGGLMSDGSGRIFFTSGNGVSPPKGPGTSPPGNLAESVVRLAISPTDGSLSAQDFFSPANAPTLDASDIDYGAGGPVELPVGTQTYPNVIVQAGKDGHIFLLNANNLGGREQAPSGGNANLFRSHPVGGQWGHPAVFEASTSPLPASTTGANDYIVYNGKNDYLREYQINTDSTDTPNLTNVANNSFTLGYTSGSPVITSNGTDPSSAVIWIVHSSGSTGTNSLLDAFDLVPNGNKLTEIWSGSIGTSSKFTIPATANGMVYVGTRDGNLYGFGLGAAALRSSGTATYPDTQVGSASSAPATVTATRTVTVTGVSVSSMSTPAPYTLGQVTETHPGGKPASVTFPVKLHKGDALHAQVTFAPAAPGGASAQVTFATSTGPGSASVPLVGDGLKTGLYATNPAMSFALFEQGGMLITNVPVGISSPQMTNIVNGGATPVTVTAVTPPAAPYTAEDLPSVGTVIQPGGSLPVQITYAPSQAVTSNGSFTITDSSGATLTVTLTGTGLPAVTQFTASPSSVSFGSVRVGHTATQYVHVVNAGNQPSLMQQAPLPGGPFGEPLRVANGLPVNGGYDLVLPVTFRPTKAGAFTGVYKLQWTDRFGTHTLNVPISGTGVG
jgi:Abnormal spindle-like microcephaly-assoc'd, ASPM-SPD-2-Hydin/PQQ-like domain